MVSAYIHSTSTMYLHLHSVLLSVLYCVDSPNLSKISLVFADSSVSGKRSRRDPCPTIPFRHSTTIVLTEQ
jgi:hypothetical protein